ncbi:high-affinity branched-chain amino acid transport, Inner-membrane translocator, livHM family [Cupriavidus taiwanensis]|uniref:branched-chain amino acid ABC transporter permease n=1 Tax=Cupriavidus taiwanensis TaxID=164546 RepID=UPI000E182374|nr:branched-chain amino acid ABC transporter permease [Cupriavidus taiwanensis]SOZ18256.1 high-affinity branched-chain amino acid transport, Inner-membrane translocator, livHM family [Cupriavidus taiwanensis]SOZ31218.1 high-affinity branched-chain amino acid transport, Inner-membrane translocator, livHM family [Cupriavidus taiwanensis]SOZ47295.1 high-affinity branched-chain amino acid transport, Inner-membrane translocator, livHM family [Cupriavidus taiwanensis]SPA02202.1 high-affinity branched
MKALQGKTGWMLLLALAIAFPLVTPNSYYLTVMTLAFIYAIATLGLNLITGYTGQLNLAHGGFMAIGAYTLGILTVDYQVPFWLAFVLAGVLCMVLGYVVGVVSLRLKGHYFSIFTMCVGYIIYLLIEKWESLTHGTVGLIGIPVPAAIGPLSFDSVQAQYYLVLAFLAIGVFLMHRIVTSLLGRSFMAVRNSDALAEALGLNLMRTKVLSFVLSVGYAGFAGALYAGQVRFLGPDIARTDLTFDMVMSMLVGGIGTLFGPLLGAVLVPWITQSLQFMQDYRMLVFGPVLVLLIIFVPDGIVGSYLKKQARKAAAERRGKLAQPAAASNTAAVPTTRAGADHA